MKKYINKLKKDNPIFDDFNFELKEDEKIKQVKDFPDYWISNYGRIFSSKNKKWKELSNKPNKKEIFKKLVNGTNHKSMGISEMVYLAFVDNIPEKYCIHHIDNDINNNYVGNLICMSKSEIASACKINKKYNTYKEISPNIIQGITSNGDTFLIDKEDLEKVGYYCWYKHQDGYMRTRFSSYKDKNR